MIKDKHIREWYLRNKKYHKSEIAKIFNVEYVHLILPGKDDLYITKYGLPVIGNLKPENHLTDDKWFDENSEKLSGTSSVYKVRTKEANGKAIDIVIKWNRMGQDIPGGYESNGLMYAQFNSPFEEFSLVMELGDEFYKYPEELFVQKPLAIFVPSETSELWRLGRKEYMMQSLISKHEEIKLDMHRSYAVIYEWIEGMDLVQAYEKKLIDKKHIESYTVEAHGKIKHKGFIVRDNKPQHVILRTDEEGEWRQNKKKRIPNGLVDFELLERTPERDDIVKKDKRDEYLKRQKDRFSIETPRKYHPHLKHTNIMGVEYIYGRVESTKGRLWVVGKDPWLFDYFLPERWQQTPRTKISAHRDFYYTVTKDNIHLVWKVSKVGLQPDLDPFKNDERKILEHGYNSPFEEFSLAVKIGKKGIPTIYPRAIYMSGNKTQIPKNLFDKSRYETHKNFKTPDRTQILNRNHDYILIWGYWNGPDDKLADKDGDYYEGIDTLRAYREGIITREEYFSLMRSAKRKMLKVGVEDLYLKGSHILISLDSEGSLVKDRYGKPEIRICNFEYLKVIGGNKKR